MVQCGGKSAYLLDDRLRIHTAKREKAEVAFRQPTSLPAFAMFCANPVRPSAYWGFRESEKYALFRRFLIIIRQTVRFCGHRIRQILNSHLAPR